MASSDRQRHALEVLKSMNKAITTLRLYPAQSVQVSNTIEKAYAELKLFIRLYDRLSFGLEKEVPTLDGVIFDRKSREQLNALSMVDLLNKTGLEAMILAHGIDRKRFKQILTFFTVNPEQIGKAGGGSTFVKAAGLGSFFSNDGEKSSSSESRVVTYNVSGYLKILIDAGVGQDDFFPFLLAKQESHSFEKMRRALKDLDKGAHILAAAVCFSLQSLQRQGVYSIASDWTLLCENMSLILKDEHDRTVAMNRLANLLTIHLDSPSLLLLCCQGESLSFFSSLVESLDKDMLRALVEFQRQESARLSLSLHQEDKASRVCVNDVGQRLMQTVKGRQLFAAEIMRMTEQQRQSKRLHAGLNALARGSLDGLKNKEILLHLPETFELLMENQKKQVAAAIIQTLVCGLKLEDAELRLRAGHGLGLIGERLVILKHWEWLEKLTPSFLHWLRTAEDADESWKRFVTLLQVILTQAEKTGNDVLADKILTLFYDLRSGTAGKKVEMLNLLGQIQDKAVDHTVLQGYLDRCFVKPIEEMYCQKIVMHGPLGIQFLLDVLLANTKRPERIRLLKILTSVGKQLPPLLLERLLKPMPWHGKRNLIRLLAATGDEPHIGFIEEYLDHEDLRVQSEALSCINTLSGQKRKQELLAALPRISEKLKFQVVQALASVVDEEVVAALVELLHDEKYFSADIKIPLLVSLCETLGRSGSLQAQKALQLFTKKAQVRPKYIDETVWQAAQSSLALIDSHRRQQKQGLAEIHKNMKGLINQAHTASERPVYKFEPVTDLAEEREVYVLLDQNRMVKARKRLLNLVITLSYLRQFDQAEILRQRLVEIDPLALEDIFYATELIEEQRGVSVEQGQGAGWAEVYDSLSKEEFNSLYSTMELVSFAPHASIATQGVVQRQLFFINKGRVKIFHRDARGNDILLKIIGSGEVLGADSFFKDSVWTVNAASVGMVDAFVLFREGLQKWQTIHPDLESKMKEFCQQNGENDSLRMIAIERRQQERLDFTGQVAVTILDDKGGAIGADLLCEGGDISLGGMCFVVRVLQNRNIRVLLGRKVRVRLPGMDSVTPPPVLAKGKIGVVVAIFVQKNTDAELAGQVQYAAHIQFDQALHEADLAGVVAGR